MDSWKEQLHHLYDFHYQGRGGMLALAYDLGVCRTTIQNWYHEKKNKLTGRVIEPTYENRLAIIELAAQKDRVDD